MTYDEFKDELVEQVVRKSEWGLSPANVRFYDDGFTAADNEEEQEFIRNTNIRYHKTESEVLIGDFMTLDIGRQGGTASQCRFELKSLYNDFITEGWEAVWKYVKTNIDVCNQITGAGVLQLMESYEAVKEKLIIRPLNFTNHKYNLKEAVYKKIGDIALVLYIVIYENDEQGLGTSKINKGIFEKWDRDIDEVWEAALTNTYVLAPPRMYILPLDRINPSYEKGAFMALGSKMKSFGKLSVPSVTTVKQVNGAIAMFYPGVKEKIASMAGGSYYVAFTSIHEAEIHCAGTIPPRNILRNLKSVDKKFGSEETLTKKVYFYNAENGKFDVLEL